MATKRTQTHSTRSFLKSLTVAGKIYAPAARDCIYTYESFEETTFHPLIASKIVGLAFLSAVAAWEEYVEETFLRYMSGATSETGYAPQLLVGTCQNRAHALRVLTAAFGHSVGSRNLRWHDFAWVQHIAKVFFRRGEPYSQIPKHHLKWLEHANVIRNRVAHNSANARKSFKRLANQYLGEQPDAPLPKGFSPGQLLVCSNLTEADQLLISSDIVYEWDCLFVAYLNIFEDLAFRLTPFTLVYHTANPTPATDKPD